MCLNAVFVRNVASELGRVLVKLGNCLAGDGPLPKIRTFPPTAVIILLGKELASSALKLLVLTILLVGAANAGAPPA